MNSIVEAAKILKDYCSNRGCHGCPFWVDSSCKISEDDRCPDEWNLDQIILWTPAEVEMAKILIEKGYKVVRHSLSEGLICTKMDSEGWKKIPSDFFESLPYGESRDLVDIVGEK